MPGHATCTPTTGSGSNSFDTVEEAIVQPSASDLTTQAQIHTSTTQSIEDFDDGDSGVEFHTNSTTTSLATSVLDYVYENGRRYHAFYVGRYQLPNDEEEQDRLDFQHHIFGLILEGQLFRAPIRSNPHRIFDMGTGTGIWAIDFADRFPSAHVVGTDLSPIQPSMVPPNCEFFVDDLERDWLFDAPFELIHGRALGGSIKDWGRLCRQAYDHLKPGGWLELQEYDWALWSDEDPKLQRAPTIDFWQSTLKKGTIEAGQNLDVASELQSFLKRSGFVDIYEEIHNIPCGNWSGNHELGNCQLAHMLNAVEPYTLRTFTQVLGWSLAEIEALMALVKREIKDKRNHLYLTVRFVYGGKVAE